MKPLKQGQPIGPLGKRLVGERASFGGRFARLGFRLCQPLHQLVGSRVLFVRLNLTGLLYEGLGLFGVVFTPEAFGPRQVLLLWRETS